MTEEKQPPSKRQRDSSEHQGRGRASGARELPILNPLWQNALRALPVVMSVFSKTVTLLTFFTAALAITKSFQSGARIGVIDSQSDKSGDPAVIETISSATELESAIEAVRAKLGETKAEALKKLKTTNSPG